ncbi:MAG: hypothetical protein BZY88_01140 [SAR202 cluster bacterium Io17-Chloro-G9]|nr:MAG: hypothetical protein BZY88_01140 [SAR202 cluster bacterium Io17-Chloro-G9]
MRTVFIVLIIVALSAVGVYATSDEPEASAALGEDTWGCTGSTAVNPPTSSPVTVGWEMNKSGEVTAAQVHWTPSDYGEYTLSVNLVAGSGSLHISEAGASPRIDSVPFPSPIPASVVELSSISVAQRLDQANDVAVTMGWLMNSTGQVTQAQVMWNPQPGSDYELLVTLGSSNGSLLVQNPGLGTRNDTISLTPAIAAESADFADLCINQI